MEGSGGCLDTAEIFLFRQRNFKIWFILEGNEQWHVVTFFFGFLDPKSKVQKLYKQLSP